MRSALVSCLVLVSGCAGKVVADAGSPSALDDLNLSLDLRSPLRCSTQQHAEAVSLSEQVQVTGCNVAVTWQLEPHGHATLDPSTFLGAEEPRIERRVDASAVVDRTLRFADAHSEGLWGVELHEDRLPWRADGEVCVRPDGDARTAFDLSQWRFLVVKVWSRDPFGHTSPYVSSRDSSLALTFDPDTPAAFRPEVVASSVQDGTWIAAWCADGPMPSVVSFNIRGAGQLSTRTVDLAPELAGDTVTALEYYVDPAQHVEASR